MSEAQKNTEKAALEDEAARQNSPLAQRLAIRPRKKADNAEPSDAETNQPGSFWQKRWQQMEEDGGGNRSLRSVMTEGKKRRSDVDRKVAE